MATLIDIHAHVFPSKIAFKAVDNIAQRYQQQADYRGLLEEYVELLKRDQFLWGVVSTAATTPEQVRPANNWAIELNRHEKLKALGTIHLDYPDWRDELERIFAAGLRGLKLHPDFQAFYADDPRLASLFEELPDGTVLLIHAGNDPGYGHLDYSHPKRLVQIVNSFPNLNIIIAHMGGYRQWNEAWRWLIGTTAYLDTASSAEHLSAQEFGEMVRAHGADRVLFGTDYPFRGPGEQYKMLREYGLEPPELAAIMGENALRLPLFETSTPGRETR